MNQNLRSIGKWVSILYRFRQNYLGKKLDPLNIGSGQHVFLMVLSRNDGISQERLTEYLKMDKATTAKALKKLEDEGYVVREIDPNDKRAYQIFLTQRGSSVIPVIQEAVSEWETVITSGLLERESLLVEELLGKMAKNACQFKETPRSLTGRSQSC